MSERRFRDMSLTEDEASRRAYGYIFDNYQAVPPYRASRYLNICTRARRLLPLWRTEAIRRNRLWFALIGLGLDIEGDSLSDMTSREMLERIEKLATAHVTVHKPHKSIARHILSELYR